MFPRGRILPAAVSMAERAASLDPGQRSIWERLAVEAVDAAMQAGATYADARLTRSVRLPLRFGEIGGWMETVGVGVRTLVNGYWGFVGAPSADSAGVTRMARDAVAQAKLYARGVHRTAELGKVPPAIGQWTTPVKIDPFTVPFEEQLALLQSWVWYAKQQQVLIDTNQSELHFLRHERVIANSEGSRFTQTTYESGGSIKIAGSDVELNGLTPSGKGWEILLEADIPGQLREAKFRKIERAKAIANPKPAQVGRYTLVCDGATMAAVINQTLGIATQLDRALGYEANASGTSFLNDPLGMLGSYQVASPLVTVTANRSLPGGLATAKWDDEGVVPDDFTLIKNGILVDYQTTREQSAWLAPYYQKIGKPVRSHGCAWGDSGLYQPIQQPPNLALTPSSSDVSLDALVANIKDGILLASGETTADFQERTGILYGEMRAIKNGRLGQALRGGVVMYDTLDFWKNVIAIGGTSTQCLLASTVYPHLPTPGWGYPVKGEPPQQASLSLQAVAATIANQPVIDVRRKA
jgi:TldD protein